MINNATNCRGCYSPESFSEEEILDLVDEQLQLETDIVSDEVYQNRLQHCQACPSLANHSTCFHCGCFVQFRAKLAYKKCPFPYGSKW